ncbi:MAG: hypothetical protein ACLFT6_03350, partial [Bacteroidales bacterium]
KMKNPKKYILIIIALLFVQVASAQNYSNKQFALINYKLEISKEFRKDLKPLKSFIKGAEVHNKDAKDKLKAIMIHHFYYHLADELKDNLKISILPVDTHMQKVKYDEFGYPKESISKILRVGDASHYFKVKIKINSLTKDMKKKDPKLDDEITFPEIKLEVSVYNNEGVIPIDKWHGKITTQSPLMVKKSLFSGLVKDSEIPLKPDTEEKQKNMFELFSMAVDDMIENIQN